MGYTALSHHNSFLFILKTMNFGTMNLNFRTLYSCMLAKLRAGQGDGDKARTLACDNVRVCYSFWQWVTRAPGCTELLVYLSPSLPPHQQKEERRGTTLSLTSSHSGHGSFQSLPLQKTMASSEQPLGKQKLLASHSSTTEQRRAPLLTQEGWPAQPWTQSSEPAHQLKGHFCILKTFLKEEVTKLQSCIHQREHTIPSVF